MTKVAMIGVGKLGQDCAEVMAQQYDVVGYDVVPRSPAFPMRDTIQSAVEDRDIIFIAAPTPHDPMYGGETPTSQLPNKDFDYSIVTDILTEVNKYVTPKQLVVLISTVLPGTVRRLLRPCITNARFIYNPYLIAMGTVKWDMVNPEMIIIGTEDGSTTGDAKELIDFYAPLMHNDPRLEIGTWDEAESIKIFYNTFISTKVALVNMIQDVAERSGNIDVDVVTNALAKSTHRIMGPAYMKAGMGDGGACHPRDNIALRDLASRLNLQYDIFDSIMTAREQQAYHLAMKCLEYGRSITIIGKAYKPGVPYTNGSSSLLVGHYIENSGGSVNYYDIHTGDSFIPTIPYPVFLIGYWEDWVEEFPFPPGSIVIDPWRRVKPDINIVKIVHYGNTRETSPTNTSLNYTNKSWNLMTQWPVLRALKDELGVYYYGRNKESLQYLSDEVLIEIVNKDLADGKGIIVFDNSHETLIESEVGKIYNILPKLNIDPSDIYYLTNSSDAVCIHEIMCERNGWDTPINIAVMNTFEFVAKHAAKIDHDKPYVIGPREKNFLNMNRMPHWHRICLLGLMLEKNLVDSSYYSFYDNEYCVSEIAETCIKSRISSEIADRILTQVKEFLPSLPLELTLDEFASNPNGISAEDAVMFDNSYFSVITETYFFTGTFLNEMDTVFISEKTYNAILMKHPFIMLGMPNTLDQMQHLGYRTFHPYIDETYDTVSNGEDRLLMIVNEIERLCSLTPDEWTEWQRNISEIVEHNYQVLMNRAPGPLNAISLRKNINE